MGLRIFLFLLLLCSSNIHLFAQAIEEYKPNSRKYTETVQYQLPLTDVESVITIEKTDGKAIFEGDIVLYDLGGLNDPSIQRDAGSVIAYGDAHDYRWGKGEIPYVIESGHPQEAGILSAISSINSQTVLNLRPKVDADQDYVLIKFNANDGNYSALGRSGGQQILSLNNKNPTGTIIHELLHAAGIYHEQSRSDRDQHITIDFSKIQKGKEGNFRSAETMSVSEYDFGSIMHYSDRAFGIDGANTITPKEKLPPGVSMGQRSALSAGDIMGILNLYKTISPKADLYKPYWFGDVFGRLSYREQGNIYRTGKDWDWKSNGDNLIDKSLSDFTKKEFQAQKDLLLDFNLTQFTLDNCQITIKGNSKKDYDFDIRFGKASQYNQWYEGQYAPRSVPSSGKFELNFSTKLPNCIAKSNETYFVALVAKSYYENGYLKAEVPIAIRYFTAK